MRPPFLTPQLLVAIWPFSFLLGIRRQAQCLGRPLGTAIRFTAPTTTAWLLAHFTNSDFANNSWLIMIEPVKPDNVRVAPEGKEEDGLLRAEGPLLDILFKAG